MTDRTVETLRRITQHAVEIGAIVDRVEVVLRTRDGRPSVEFTAHYRPKPLEQSTGCIGYFADET